MVKSREAPSWSVVYQRGNRAVALTDRERWPSGLRRTLGKRVYRKVPWVRIPLSPPSLQTKYLAPEMGGYVSGYIFGAPIVPLSRAPNFPSTMPRLF